MPRRFAIALVLALLGACSPEPVPGTDAPDVQATDAADAADGALSDAADTADAGSDVAADVADTLASDGLGWTADAQPPFPVAQDVDLPVCPTVVGKFELPELSATGDIELVGSGWLQAVGVVETLDVRIRKPGSESTDVKAAGPLTLTGTPGVTVVSVGTPAAGVTTAKVTFATAGRHTLTASLPDGRQGVVEFEAYVSPLPIWEVEIAPVDWKAMVADPYDRTYYPATFKAEGQVFAGAEIRLHGGASSEMPKKSFRVNLPKGQQLKSGERKLILRAEYVDKTMLRTRVSYEIYRATTWLPTPKTEYVHLRINGRYYGLMNHVQRIGGDFLQAWGLNPDGNLYESDPPNELAVEPGGKMTPMAPELYAQVYAKQAGTKDVFDDLIALIEGVLQLPKDAFAAAIDQQLRVDDWLAYAAGMAVLQNHEHIRKNFYLYRDPAAADDRWVFFPWDLDLTLGHLWTEEKDVLDETIFTQMPLDVGLDTGAHGFYNQVYRVLENPAYRKRFFQFVLQIADTGLAPDFLDQRLETALCTLRLDFLADKRKRSSVGEYLDRVDEIRAYAQGRRAFIHEELGVP
jgi:hypothetical protein